ncbi:MAG: DUF2079 domain-containing protein [Thermoleophilia bacterium]
MIAAGAFGAAVLTVAWVTTSSLLVRSSGKDFTAVSHRAMWPFTAFVILPLEFLPFSALQTAGEETILRPMDQAWQALMVLILAAGLVFSLMAYRFPVLQKGPISMVCRHPIITLLLFMAVWLTAACVMDILKTHFMNKTGGYNTPIFTDALRHTFSDKGPIYSNMLMANGSSVLGIHSSFIWFLVYPLFAIWPSYEWIIILSNAAIALAAIPIYLLSRRFFSPGIGLLLVALFLLNRIVISQPGIGDLSELRFLPVLFLTAFYFWHTERFLPFTVFAFLCLTVREDLGIILVVWGLLAAFQRRSFKWVCAPIAMGGLWLAIMAAWVLPFYNPIGQPASRAVSRYGHLGNSAREIFTNLIKPWILFRFPFSTVRHLAVWYTFFLSFGFVAPVLVSPIILSFVPVAEILFLSHPGLNLFNMLAVAATAFPAMILGLHAADRISAKKWHVKVSTSLILVSLFSTAALSYTWFNPSLFTPRYNYETALEILNKMPSGTSVILPDFMAAIAEPTHDVRGYYQVVYETNQSGELNLDQDYVVVDQNMPPRFQDTNLSDGLNQIKLALASSSKYVIILDKDDLQVYKNINHRVS